MLNVNSNGNRFSDLACTSRIDISVVLSFLWRSFEVAVSTIPCKIFQAFQYHYILCYGFLKIVLYFFLFHFNPSNPPAEWPPISLLRSIFLEPSVRTVPFCMAKKPNCSLTTSIAVWSLLSFQFVLHHQRVIVEYSFHLRSHYKIHQFVSLHQRCIFRNNTSTWLTIVLGRFAGSILFWAFIDFFISVLE